MKEFTQGPLKGEWWSPEDPKKIFAGELSLNEEFHGTLTLYGEEKGLLKYWASRSTWTIFGRLNGRYTYEVTLFRLGVRRSTSKGRDAAIEFITNQILIGAYIKTLETPFILGSSIALSGLDEWCDTSGFSGRPTILGEKLGTEKVELKYAGTRSPMFSLGENNYLRLISYIEAPLYFENVKNISLREKDRLELNFGTPISLLDLQREIGSWQSFLTLSLRRQSFPIDVKLTDSEGGNFHFSLIAPGWYARKDSPLRDARQLLLTRSKLGTRPARFIKAWRQNFGDLEHAIMLFVGTEYQDGIFSHSRILAYLQALEVLHRELYGGRKFDDKPLWERTLKSLRAAIPAEITDDLKLELQTQLGFLGSISLAGRLKHLFSLYPKCLAPLFRDGNSDMDLLKDVRNFLTHFGETRKFDRAFLTSRELLIMAEKTRLFVEICLLGSLGMSDSDILSLLREFQPYLALSYEPHRS